MTLHEEKNQLRKSVRDELAKLTAEEKISASARILDRVVGEIGKLPAQPKIIASFRGLSIEPDLSGMLAKFPDSRLVYPLCRKDRVLEFYHISDPERQLKKGYYGLYEPDPERSELVEISEIEVFLVPSFAYTCDGKRLGKGGGYYDRALAKKQADALTIGVAFECQLLENLPTEPHDIMVDQVIAL